MVDGSLDKENGSGEEEEEGSGEKEEEEEDGQGGKDVQEEDDDEIFFSRGAYDNKFLKTFKGHVALQVWKHYKKPATVFDRGVLKTYHLGTAMLGKDVRKFASGRVEAVDLLPLLTYNLPSVDKTMMSAFVERWQPETSSFHMPFGEMTITLDDVSSLLHIPVAGKFSSLPTLTREEAVIVLHKQLGVTQAEAEAEIRKSLL
ncbi:protein MAIN-LIKE 2-like [Lotus japonicus]|uniref:protein MAIN-LIKE 2-like n=1 Tax=Lotus japonicus TaxID=34305 RepID=UPI0025909BB7|nr:protein MAIN-LIKE 2-like [Lotus japonicus]